MSEVNGNYDTQEEYIGRVENDMYYPKTSEPQSPPIKPKTPTEDLDDIIQSFEYVDVRKISDEQLQRYFDVAYESYLYAEAIINKRERMRTNK